MSQFIALTGNVHVAGQISITDIDDAKTQGITMIINNRPDGEADDQPVNADLAAYAMEKGVKWATIPVAGAFPLEAIEMMASALKSAEGPVLAFCRTGTRSTHLWALAEAMNKNLSAPDLVEAAKKGGYNISSLTPTLEHLYMMNA